VFLTSVTQPDGETQTIYGANGKISSVFDNLGWVAQFTYSSGTDTIIAANLSTNYCVYTLTTCSLDPGSPTETIGLPAKYEGGTYYNNGILQETVTGYQGAPSQTPLLIFSAVSPSGVTRNYYQDPNCIPAVGQYQCEMSVTLGNNTTLYNFIIGMQGNGQAFYDGVSVTNPDASTKTVFISLGEVGSVTDELNRNTSYKYTNSFNWGEGEISQVLTPESAALPQVNGAPVSNTQYVYTNGAVSQVTVIGSDGSKHVTTASGMATCTLTNYRICNKPTKVVDANGHETDYTWDVNSGGVLTETGPADVNGVRPQKRYTYTLMFAQVLNSTGALVDAATPVYRLTGISSCLTATAQSPASCVGTSQEHVTVYQYNNNNLMLTKETQSDGTGAISASLAYTYDSYGNRVSVKGPRTDVNDTRYVTYDVLRRPVYEIGPDPDGAGPLRRATVHHMYDVDGREYRTEKGSCGTVTFAGAVPTACADFAVAGFRQNTYDPSTGYLITTVDGTP
jgi:hypothetical protein